MRKTIIHIIGSSSFDGGCYMAYRLSNDINRYNHYVFNQKIGAAQNELLNKRISLLFPSIVNSYLRIFLFIFLILLLKYQKRSFIIHYHTGSLTLLFILSVILSSKLLFTFHCKNIHCKPKQQIGFIREILYNQIFKSSKLTSVSNTSKNLISLKFQDYDIELIRNAVPVSKKNKTDSFSLSFGYLGQISHTKGAHEIFEFVKSIAENKISFYMMGEIKDKYSQELYNESKSKINFLNPSFNKEFFFDKISFLLFPSKYESFGLVVLEAIQKNCMVLCYRTESNIEILTEDYPLFVDNFDSSNIINIVKEVIENKYLRCEILGLFSKIKEKYNYSAMIKNYSEVYENILKFGAIKNF